MDLIHHLHHVAVIGSGIAGATCARALSRAGHEVHVVDKSRGAGGRLATRRLEWLDAQGRQRIAKVDHGAPAFMAAGAAFREFCAEASQAGDLTSWRPTLAPGSRPLDDAGPLFLPQPDMPSLCRGLLRGIATTWSFAIDRLRRVEAGWQAEASGQVLPGLFDAVVLALPPAQAAPLLAPHRGDWAQRASLALMQPCWSLMGVSRRTGQGPPWDVARPEQGPLAWVMRQDARPGRERAAGEALWVAHARPGWSRQHLEQPADWVRQQMQSAMQEVLGEPLDWQHAVVHRWRYAMPRLAGAAPEPPCWWDGVRGLGVCGDFLGGAGVEGAWLSARALGESMGHRNVRTTLAPGSPLGSPLTDQLFPRAA